MSKSNYEASQKGSSKDLQAAAITTEASAAAIQNNQQQDNATLQISSRTMSENNFGLGANEEEKCNEAFLAFDKDGNEEIDIDELRIVLKMMGI